MKPDPLNKARSLSFSVGMCARQGGMRWGALWEGRGRGTGCRRAPREIA